MNNSRKAKLLKIIFIIAFSALYSQKIFAAVDFCQSTKYKPFAVTLNSLQEQIGRIQKSDLVLSEVKKKQMDETLLGISKLQEKPDDQVIQSIQNEAKMMAEGSLSSVQKVFDQAALVIDNQSEPTEPIENLVSEAINTELKKITLEPRSLVNPGLPVDRGNFEIAKNKMVHLLAITQFFREVSDKITALQIKMENCTTQEFSFTAKLSDGKQYAFSNCIDLLVRDRNAKKWGTATPEGSCRNILNCFTQEEPKQPSYFKGFGYEWIVDCKKLNGKCQKVDECVRNTEVDSTTIRKVEKENSTQ